MPVRLMIHSSDVSSVAASSAFVTMSGGRWTPVPVIVTGTASALTPHRPRKRCAPG